MRINVVTIFPEYFASPLAASLVGRAQVDGLLDIDTQGVEDHQPTNPKHERYNHGEGGEIGT